jgi:hypothetical protein
MLAYPLTMALSGHKLDCHAVLIQVYHVLGAISHGISLIQQVDYQTYVSLKFSISYVRLTLFFFMLCCSQK